MIPYKEQTWKTTYEQRTRLKLYKGPKALKVDLFLVLNIQLLKLKKVPTLYLYRPR